MAIPKYLCESCLSQLATVDIVTAAKDGSLEGWLSCPPCLWTVLDALRQRGYVESLELQERHFLILPLELEPRRERASRGRKF